MDKPARPSAPGFALALLTSARTFRWSKTNASIGTRFRAVALLTSARTFRRSKPTRPSALAFAPCITHGHTNVQMAQRKDQRVLWRPLSHTLVPSARTFRWLKTNASFGTCFHLLELQSRDRHQTHKCIRSVVRARYHIRCHIWWTLLTNWFHNSRST